MNKRNASGRHIENENEFLTSGEVGDWSFRLSESETPVMHILIWLPCGPDDKSVAVLPVHEHPDASIPGAWYWNGNIESPTVEPSIFHHAEDEWHGWMTEGQLISA